MGSMSAIGMKEMTEELRLPLESALEWHLRANHYPPVHPVFIPVAMEAIQCARIGDYREELDLEKITGDTGFRKPVMTVHEIMDGLHLWDYLDTDDE